MHKKQRNKQKTKHQTNWKTWRTKSLSESYLPRILTAVREKWAYPYLMNLKEIIWCRLAKQCLVLCLFPSIRYKWTLGNLFGLRNQKSTETTSIFALSLPLPLNVLPLTNHTCNVLSDSRQSHPVFWHSAQSLENK